MKTIFNFILKASRWLLAVAIPLLIIGGAILLAKKMIDNAPAPPVVDRAEVVPDVTVVKVAPKNVAARIRSQGTVEAYFRTEVASEVNGAVVEISESFQVGNQVEKGEMLLRIDSTNYVSALARAKADLASAKEQVVSEKARAEQARSDWQRLGRRSSRPSVLALREPQIATANALLLSGEAAIVQAEKDLERTVIRAPYNAIIEQRLANPGDVLSVAKVVGRLFATDRFEVRLPLSPQDIGLLELPPVSDPVTITLTSPVQPGKSWQAVIKRTEASINTTNRSTFAIAEIAFPLEDRKNYLRIGSFVQTMIEGKEMRGVYELPDSALIEDHYLWFVDKSGKLKRTGADRIMSERSTVFVRLPEIIAGSALDVVSRPLPSMQTGMQVVPVLNQ